MGNEILLTLRAAERMEQLLRIFSIVHDMLDSNSRVVYQVGRTEQSRAGLVGGGSKGEALEVSGMGRDDCSAGMTQSH